MSTPTDSAVEVHIAHCRARVWTSIYRPIYLTNPPLPYIQVTRGPAAPSGVLLFETPLAEGSDDDLGPVSTLIRFRQKRSAQDLRRLLLLGTGFKLQ